MLDPPKTPPQWSPVRRESEMTPSSPERGLGTAGPTVPAWAGTPRAHEPTAAARLAHSLTWALCSFIPVPEQPDRSALLCPHPADRMETGLRQAGGQGKAAPSQSWALHCFHDYDPPWALGESLLGGGPGLAGRAQPRPLSGSWGLGLPRSRMEGSDAWRVGRAKRD